MVLLDNRVVFVSRRTSRALLEIGRGLLLDDLQLVSSGVTSFAAAGTPREVATALLAFGRVALERYTPEQIDAMRRLVGLPDVDRFGRH